MNKKGGIGFLGVVIIIAVIFLVIAVLNGGFESWKSKPIKQSLDTGKDIYATSVNVVDKTKDVVEIISSPANNLGQIPCVDDSDCLQLDECDNATKICQCLEGWCYKVVE